MNLEIIGILAGLLTSSSFLPQILKIYKMKSAEEISLPFLLMQLIGILLWLFYGFTISSIAVVFANILAAIGIFTLILEKLLYR
ncbi:MAG: SemiSWEET family transporter [Candidatus Methanomethyliaceae archaeon]|nr:SemiSWEET family transporter [Candidatus Methanomethyliaceae archaeon]MDW7970533.1 SemiSWEET family transporter [Nitrososphaerota archaeon]